jgi:hypothetical protein
MPDALTFITLAAFNSCSLLGTKKHDNQKFDVLTSKRQQKNQLINWLNSSGTTIKIHQG